jgi:hypothetical protein
MQNIYTIRTLADPGSPEARAAAGGDSVTKIFDNNTNFLRILSEFPPGSVNVALRFVFEPENQFKQNRLRIYLISTSSPVQQEQCLSLLMEKGPLNQFYTIEKAQACPVEWSQFSVFSDITRKQTLSKSTLAPGFNSRAMPYYYLIEPFRPENSNDYMQLDNILDRLTAPALIEVCVEPVQTAAVSMYLSECISCCQAVNRSWEHDQEDIIHLGGGLDGRDWSSALRPLRQKECLVDDILRKTRSLNETLTRRHLKFSIRIFAADKPAARLLGSVVAESALRDGIYQMHDFCRGDEFFDFVIQNAEHAELMAPPVFEACREVKTIDLYRNISTLCSMSTVDEIAGVFRLPVACVSRSPRCIRKDTDPKSIPPQDMIVIGTDENGVKAGIELKSLVKHCSIFGLPGSGKSILSTSIMSQLCMRNIPFILFEPGKSEYRRLKCLKKSKSRQAAKLAAQLGLFTPGSSISPLGINPLQIPDGIGVYEHIENLLCCFKAAMPMEGPMVGILAEALEQVCLEYPDPARPAVIADVYQSVNKTLAAKSYCGEVKSNIKAAFDVRLGQLSRRSIGQVLKNRYACPGIKELLKGFSIIELALLPSEAASLITLFILTMICEHLRSTPYNAEGVRLAIILEEAHNLVGPDTNAAVNEANADPKAFAAEFICRMLAELRSLGIAIIILDQMPSAVASQVVKNTGSKIVFRQVDLTDRRTIGGAMLFNDVDTEQLCRLVPGQAYLHTEGRYRPQLVFTPNLKQQWNIPEPPVGERILPLIKRDEWFLKSAGNRIVIQTQHFKEGLERYILYRKSLISQIEKLQSRFLHLSSDDPQTPAAVCQIQRNAQLLLAKFCDSEQMFERLYYNPYISFERHADLARKPVRDYLDKQLSRYVKICRLNQKYRDFLKSLINTANHTLNNQETEDNHGKNIHNP